MKGTPKIRRKASVDSDTDCCTESDERLLASHHRAMVSYDKLFTSLITM